MKILLHNKAVQVETVRIRQPVVQKNAVKGHVG